MYGITQEEIFIEYIPSQVEAIPGYSAVLIIITIIFSISILLWNYRKNQ
ncbi:MAG: Loki-CTERM sorting domain-containing protein [Candidatus Thorarchaeota archaeon]